MKYLEILIKLRKIIRSINLESKRIEKQYGISIPQLLVLQFLSEQEEYKATSKNIKLHINLNASTVSGIISRLESKNLVARLPSINDKRANYITLAANGAELLRQCPETLQQKLAAKLKILDPEEIDGLNKNIDLLILLLDAGGSENATAEDLEPET